MTLGGCKVIDLSFSWAGIPPCSSVSPEFQLKNVPDGTTRLTFWMTDLDVPNDFHGGGDVDYTGPAVPKDAFAKSGQAVLLSDKYVGPCSTAPHNYQFEVNAIDGSGNYVGTGKATRPYPP